MDIATMQRVEHNYHDHSNEISEAAAGQDDQHRVFPVQLHHVLAHLEREGLAHVASWQPHGRCFVVHNREEFVRLVLPRYFAQHSFGSFQRQCNIYGFKRLTAGLDKGGYYHELFLRGMGGLAHSIVRVKKKNKGPRKPASPETEPDFYAMPSVPRQNNAPAVGFIGQSSVGMRTWLCPPGSVPYWPINDILPFCGTSISEPRETKSTNPPQVSIPDLLAAVIPGTPQAGRDGDADADEEEYRRQLLEPVVEFTF